MSKNCWDYKNCGRQPGGSKVETYGLCPAAVELLVAKKEQNRLESLLQQSRKMESIGTMAAGVAHDFNNILCPIFGYVELALLNTEDQPVLKEYLTQIHKSSVRARDLVKQILTFSRQDNEKFSPVEVHSIIKEVMKLLRSTIPATIEFQLFIDPHCGYVLANSTQVHQLVINLCTNAYHAMRETGGTLKVSLVPVEISPEDAERDLELAPGPYLLLEVSDTGHGMNKKVLGRIFDPYFTTKSQGEGTGMGLALVHGIVKAHGGNITVRSEPGEGSAFHVYFPVMEGAAVENAAIIPGFPPPSKNERIMLIDDEESVLEVEKRILEALGYRVVSFGSAREALADFHADPKRYDLVVTDMTMPGMTGDKLARELLALRPEIPVILCTGFSDLIDQESALKIGISQFVTKPINMLNFARILRDTLDGRKNG